VPSKPLPLMQMLPAEQKLAKARTDIAVALATFQNMLAESQEAFTADIEGTKAAHQREIQSRNDKHEGSSHSQIGSRTRRSET
jgi:hypothetical protein